MSKGIAAEILQVIRKLELPNKSVWLRNRHKQKHGGENTILRV